MSRQRFFFTHVMKAAGTSFLRYAHANLEAEAFFFKGGANSLRHHFDGHLSDLECLDIILKVEPEVFRYLPWHGARFFEGHMPAVVSRTLETETKQVHCLTVLRHPVQRVVSHLVQEAMYTYGQAHLSQGIEAIYRNSSWRNAHGVNYQSKLFSMDESETFADGSITQTWREVMRLMLLITSAPSFAQRLEAAASLAEKYQNRIQNYSADSENSASQFENVSQSFGRVMPQSAVLEITSGRLSSACDALENFALVGIAEQMHEVAEYMAWRFGWKGPVKQVRPGVPVQPSPALLKQIARDNEADIEFYNYARTLSSKRKQERLRSYHIL